MDIIKLIKVITVVGLVWMISANGYAQDSIPKKKWDFVIEPYVMFPNMNGHIGIGRIKSAKIDQDTGDIFSKLRFGGMLYLEARTDQWAFSSDVLYMDLKQDLEPDLALFESGEASASQLGYELAGLYRINSFLEVGLAAKYNSIKSDLDLVISGIGNNTYQEKFSVSENWFDPAIVCRLTHTYKEKWFGMFRGDIGGFSIGSDFTWQIQAYVGYRFSKLFYTSLGYRVISIDYESGSGNDFFYYDVRNHGVNIRLGFNL